MGRSVAGSGVSGDGSTRLRARQVVPRVRFAVVPAGSVPGRSGVSLRAQACARCQKSPQDCACERGPAINWGQRRLLRRSAGRGGVVDDPDRVELVRQLDLIALTEEALLAERLSLLADMLYRVLNELERQMVRPHTAFVSVRLWCMFSRLCLMPFACRVS